MQNKTDYSVQQNKYYVHKSMLELLLSNSPDVPVSIEKTKLIMS